jgi:hypothetical protein
MRAKLTVDLAGDPSRSPGDIVTGPDAVRLCAAGFAVPETEKRETAVAKKVTKEVR